MDDEMKEKIEKPSPDSDAAVKSLLRLFPSLKASLIAYVLSNTKGDVLAAIDTLHTFVDDDNTTPGSNRRQEEAKQVSAAVSQAHNASPSTAPATFHVPNATGAIVGNISGGKNIGHHSGNTYGGGHATDGGTSIGHYSGSGKIVGKKVVQHEPQPKS